MNRQIDVLIGVRGGVAFVEENKVNANVIIVDWDEEGQKGVDIYNNKKSVIVEGIGGNFEIVHCPYYIDAAIIDYDNENDQ